MNRTGRFLFGVACLIVAGSGNLSLAQSIDSLNKEVNVLTSENLKGRGAGSQGEKEAAAYIYDFMQNIGAMMLSPRDGDDFGIANPVTGDTLQSRNIVGIIPGYDPSLTGEFILLGAQLDGPGSESLNVNGVRQERILPGAYSNASGTAILMQVARMIAENKFMFRRPVLIAFFGAGNFSQAGSWYFLNRSFADKDKIRFMVDINSIGRDSGPNTFQAFIGLPDKEILKDIFTVEERPFSLSVKIAEQEPLPSDYRNFHSEDIPFTLFTTGDSPIRGTIHDTPQMLDYVQMSQAVEFIYTYALTLAGRDTFEKKDDVEAQDSYDRIYSQLEVDRRASFFKGDERTFLKDWVYHYVKYPDSAIASHTEGTEVAEFTVDKNGKVKDVKITTSLSDDIDKEVLKVIKASPKWTPAQLNGRNVPVKISIAVEFKLAQGSKVGFNR